MTDLFRLDGKVAIVTGSTRGIGRGIATAMRDARARVVLSSENAEETGVAALELGVVGLHAASDADDPVAPDRRG